MATVASAVVRPDGSVHPDLVPPEGMIALTWAVNIRPATMAEIEGLRARARTLAPAIEQLAVEVRDVLESVNEQFSGQSLTSELIAHARGAVGGDALVEEVSGIRDALSDALRQVGTEDLHELLCDVVDLHREMGDIIHRTSQLFLAHRPDLANGAGA